jgi:CHAD domain-containing protein
MGTDHDEVEIKLDVAEEVELPPLDVVVGTAGVASVSDPEDIELEATYFDTEDLALAAAGVSMRRRVGGADEGWHMKLRTKDARREVHLPLSRAKRNPPKAFRDTVQILVGDRPTGPVTVLRTHRRVYRLLDEQGAVLAEVCDDRVSASNPLPPVRTDQSEGSDGDAAEVRGDLSWREWEVELVAGEHELLEAVGEVLQRAGAVPTTRPAKLALALGDRMPAPVEHPHGAPRRKGPSRAVAGARIAEQVTELLRCDPLVRLDAEDSVHQMRVASRRLRSALATYRPLLDRTVTDPFRNELKWVGVVLGAARDAEVVRDRLREAVAEERPDLLVGPVGYIDRRLGEGYRAAHAASVEAMSGDRYRALVAGLEALVESPPWSERATEPTRELLLARVRHDRKRVARAVKAVGKADDSDERDQLLHEVRKAAKRARYAAEPLVDLFPDDAPAFVDAYKEVQSTLGDLHDTVATRAALRRLSAEASGERYETFSYGVLYLREEAAGEAYHAAYVDALAVAENKQTRAWLRR